MESTLLSQLYVYSRHSYTFGAATFAAAVGIPESLILIPWRQRGTAYKICIRSPQ